MAYLDREVVRPEGQMVTATQGWILLPHVHLQMLEKVLVLENEYFTLA